MLTIDWIPAYLAKLDFWSYFAWRLINEVRHEHFHSGCGCLVVIKFVAQTYFEPNPHTDDLWWYFPNWLPGFFTSPMHDYHHQKNNGCYALWFRAMDWIFGSDRGFLEHQAKIKRGEVDEIVADE
jgi:hypothetical protein